MHLSVPNFLKSLCIFTIVLWSFLPAFGVSLAASGKSSWLEICTAQGIERIALNDDYTPPGEDEDQGEQNNAGGHCPLCSLRLAALVPETPALHLRISQETVSIEWPSQDSTHISRITLQPLQARAPPTLS